MASMPHSYLDLFGGFDIAGHLCRLQCEDERWAGIMTFAQGEAESVRNPVWCISFW